MAHHINFAILIMVNKNTGFNWSNINFAIVVIFDKNAIEN